ncbi:stalled replication fork rescue ATPase, long form [Syntrophotalea carbinolica DSM 2380]|uniref:Replication-associated recombination protein A n=1 Tax=Syntrophotalea carbinolica (strain DSM 2380 / NBRC 103641 / GraBd1) TaxID=338963 RepID=Q3A5K5_SYNC1|nr:AAA family ATPase [Syntrophotalea carbinolica]ABA88352.1 stalled replication fork rescue ATPase, long form [Syntrophotalea carbinolica DSM 2380]
MNLFSQASSFSSEPLASRMRPRTLEEYVGQDHILGEGRLLRRAIRADQLSSLIFYGPPGTGKTTLAQVIANSTASRFVSMNAVLSGVKDLREAIEDARQSQEYYDKRTILFVDEVHRWNKSQQDALLPWVEKGTIILIGATTENPYFEVNKALVSRSRVFQLLGLTEENLRQIVTQTLQDKQRGYGKWQVEFEPDALDHLVRVASGDARSLLNALQLAVETTPESFPPPANSRIHITLSAAEESIQQKAVLYDKEGDYHFDTISAFIKSLRGSDPDAALYWMARMVRAGEDPRYIFRRMLISASEDVGMADPYALGVVEAAASAFDRVGLPEGQFHLTQATLYLATCPKSNSSLAFFDALEAVAKEEAEVPNHLRDSSRDEHSFGHGKGYKYPHAFRDHWVAQQYLPGTLKGRIFYQPTGQGYEGSIQTQVIRHREEQLDRMLEETPETLSFSPGDKERDRWIRRVQGTSSSRKKLLKALVEPMQIGRSDRIFLAPLRWNQLFWELFRKVPEGGLTALADQEDYRNLVEFSMESLPESERPLLVDRSLKDPRWLEHPDLQPLTWEHIVLDGVLDQQDELFPQILEEKLAPKGWFTGCLPLPGAGSRLSELLKGRVEDKLLSRIEEGEELFYTERAPYPQKERMENLADLTLVEWTQLPIEESLVPNAQWLAPWFKDLPGSWFNYVSRNLGEDEIRRIRALLQPEKLPSSFPWTRNWLIYRLRKSAT